MAVLSVLQSAAVSTAQPIGGELLEPAPADAVGQSASLHVSHIEAFDPAGGDAIFEPGTEYKEPFAYDSVDIEEGLLVGLTRPAPLDHPEGAFVQAGASPEPSPSASPSPSTEPASTAPPAASAEPAAPSTEESTNTEDLDPSANTSSVVGEPCEGSCVDEVATLLGENIDCTGTSEDPVGCEVTAAPSCDGQTRVAVDDSCLQAVSDTLLPGQPETEEIQLIEGPGYQYGGKISLQQGVNQIPEAALPGELNAFSVSPGLPINPDNPLDNTRAELHPRSRYCTYGSTSYREGYVGEGDDGLSAADDELGAHTATRASSGPYVVSSSYREANAWTRAGVAITFRMRGQYTANVSVMFPWNVVGEMSVTEGNGRAAGGMADLRLGVMDITSCRDGATTTQGCGSTVVYEQVKGYERGNAGVAHYGPDEGRNLYSVSVADKHTYVFFVEMGTMSWAQGNVLSSSTGNAFVDFYGGPLRGWLDWVSIRSDAQRFSSCGY